jgi:hypothetical protein
MTITAQSLTTAEKNKFKALRRGMSEEELEAMDKTLSRIVQSAISGAGAAEAANIKTRIALALRRTFNLE